MRACETSAQPECRDVAALLRELQCLGDEPGAAIEIEPGDCGGREIVGRVRLEILAADLPRDLERLADPALVVVEIAEPPADAGPGRERFVSILRLPVLEQHQRLLDELAPTGQVRFAEKRVLGERR